MVITAHCTVDNGRTCIVIVTIEIDGVHVKAFLSLWYLKSVQAHGVDTYVNTVYFIYVSVLFI